jgi:hypothetical protein
MFRTFLKKKKHVLVMFYAPCEYTRKANAVWGTTGTFHPSAVALSSDTPTSLRHVQNFTCLFCVWWSMDLEAPRSTEFPVKAPCYQLEGRGFQTRWGECIFSICLILPAALGPGIYSTSNRNEYQKQKNNVYEE